MPKSGCEKLEIRVRDLLSNANLVKEGNAHLLYDVPVITPKQVTVLLQRDEVRGVYKKSSVRRDFRSVLRRHRNRQLRAYIQNCRHQVRVLRKLIKDYVEMPGVAV